MGNIDVKSKPLIFVFLLYIYRVYLYIYYVHVFFYNDVFSCGHKMSEEMRHKIPQSHTETDAHTPGL